MIKRTVPNVNVTKAFRYPPHPEGLPMHMRPDVWLDLHIRNGLSKYLLYTKLLECTVGAEIRGVIKFLPSNLFDEFKEILANMASFESEEEFVIVGSTPASPLRLQDVLRVIQWLKENPNPELGPQVED